MSYIYLVTRKDGFPIVGFTKKYSCDNFLSFNRLGDTDVNIFTMREGQKDGQVGAPKKVDKDFLKRK